MLLIKFHENYVIEGKFTFLKNGIWEYIDKYENFTTEPCVDCVDQIKWYYRVQFEYIIYHIPDTHVVQMTEQDIYNKDYTRPGWDEKITTDAMVDDGDYVKAWEESLGIAKPVKPRADQCDYRGEWYELKKRIDKFYAGGSNGTSSGENLN